MVLVTMDTDARITCLLILINLPFDVFCGDVTDLGVPDDSSLRYWLHSNDVTSSWDEADDICKATYSGGHLAALPTPELTEFVQDQLNGSQGILNTYPDQVVWLGGRRSLDDTWRLLDGSSARYGELGTEDRPGQDIDCLIWTSQLFLAETCDRRYENFICFLHGDACGVTAQPSPGGCFSLRIGEELTWYESRQKCQDLGGDLADVDYYNQSNVAAILRNNNETWTGKAWIKPKRHPWEWSFNEIALEYYDWSYYKLHMTGENCLQTAPDGWRPANCTQNVTSHFLCTELIDPNNPGASTTTTTDWKVIIGSLAGALVVLVVIIVVLVVCLRRAKKTKMTDAYETRDFSFCSAAPNGSIMSTISDPRDKDNLSGAGTPSVPPVYEDAIEVHQQGSQSVSPYATTSIEDVIERNSKKGHGSALNAVKKRLSWIMKRENQDTAISVLPTPPATIKRGPDVVPQTLFPPNRAPNTHYSMTEENPYEMFEDANRTSDSQALPPAPPTVPPKPPVSPRVTSATELVDNVNYEMTNVTSM